MTKLIAAFRDYLNVSKYYVEGKVIGNFNADVTEYTNEKHGVAGALALIGSRPWMLNVINLSFASKPSYSFPFFLTAGL
jgi:hypothetical protein